MVTFLSCLGILLMLSNATLPSSAQRDRSFMKSANDPFENRADWMSSIRDDVKLSELAIPGTHDSAAYSLYYDVSVLRVHTKTHFLNFDKQLAAGIRFFDIRIKHTGNEFLLYHGPISLDNNFGNFLDSVTKFLNAHPTEVVLFRFKQEGDSEANNRSDSATLDAYMSNPKYSPYFLETNHLSLSVDDARGKFVILCDARSICGGRGLNYGCIDKQDQYNLGLTLKYLLDWKWEQIRDHLQKVIYGDKNQFYMDYLSATSPMATPYFVASGEQYPNRRRRRRHYYHGMYDSDMLIFDGTNYLAMNKIREYNLGTSRRTVGIIVADFPGDGLIDAIVKNNDKFNKYLGSIPPVQPQCTNTNRDNCN